MFGGFFPVKGWGVLGTVFIFNPIWPCLAFFDAKTPFIALLGQNSFLSVKKGGGRVAPILPDF